MKIHMDNMDKTELNEVCGYQWESIDAFLFYFLLLKVPGIHVNRGNSVMNHQNIHQPKFNS